MSDDDSGGSSTDTIATDDILTAPSDGGDLGASGEPLSFLEQLWQSIVGVLIGFVVVLGSIAGIFWNENNAVQVARALDEGLGVTIAAPADSVLAANEGRMIHVVGNLASVRGVRDDLLGVSGQGVRMQRSVEMYQWKESSSTKDGRRTYSYSREWSSTPQDSSRFREAASHSNPRFLFQSQTFRASDAMLGPYRLGEPALSAFQSRSETRVAPPQATLDAVARRIGRPGSFVDGQFFVARDHANPEIGDLRISWRLIAVGQGSVAARQTSGELTAYTARNGRPVLLAATGAHSAEAMFAQGQADNQLMTWLLRALAVFFMFLGFFFMLGPFTFLASYIPVVGDIFAAGAAAIALVMTLLVGGGSIAIAWFAVRPLLTAAIAGGVILAVIGFKYLSRGKAQARIEARHVRQAPAARQGFGQRRSGQQ